MMDEPLREPGREEESAPSPRDKLAVPQLRKYRMRNNPGVLCEAGEEYDGDLLRWIEVHGYTLDRGFMYTMPLVTFEMVWEPVAEAMGD